MEKERLLQEAPDRLADRSERNTHLPLITLRGCVLLLLLSVVLNCTLVGLLAQRQGVTHGKSEYGQCLSIRTEHLASDST